MGRGRWDDAHKLATWMKQATIKDRPACRFRGRTMHLLFERGRSVLAVNLVCVGPSHLEFDLMGTKKDMGDSRNRHRSRPCTIVAALHRKPTGHQADRPF